MGQIKNLGDISAPSWLLFGTKFEQQPPFFQNYTYEVPLTFSWRDQTPWIYECHCLNSYPISYNSLWCSSFAKKSKGGVTSSSEGAF